MGNKAENAFSEFQKNISNKTVTHNNISNTLSTLGISAEGPFSILDRWTTMVGQLLSVK